MQCYPFETAECGGYDIYSPAISEYTMYFHYEIYKKYVKRLNELAENDSRLTNVPLEKLICSRNENVRYNACGVFNHSLYFSGLSAEEQKITGVLEKRIISAYGSSEAFYERFMRAGENFRGSGYVWICEDNSGRVRIGVTTGQNTPDRNELNPLLCCDIWEHAYYLDYQNRRREYLEIWFSHACWEKAEKALKRR